MLALSMNSFFKWFLALIVEIFKEKFSFQERMLLVLLSAPLCRNGFHSHLLPPALFCCVVCFFEVFLFVCAETFFPLQFD